MTSSFFSIENSFCDDTINQTELIFINDETKEILIRNNSNNFQQFKLFVVLWNWNVFELHQLRLLHAVNKQYTYDVENSNEVNAENVYSVEMCKWCSWNGNEKHVFFVLYVHWWQPIRWTNKIYLRRKVSR